jgi:hypothetical protein
MHLKFVWQSMSCEHEVRQPLVPQAKPLGHDPPVVLHAPAPSHLPSHAAPQIVWFDGYAHALEAVPSHVPPQVDPAPAHGARLPWGGPITGEQVPRACVSQAWHCPVHAESQQTPSTQNPEAQMSADEHFSPKPLFAGSMSAVAVEPSLSFVSTVMSAADCGKWPLRQHALSMHE